MAWNKPHGNALPNTKYNLNTNSSGTNMQPHYANAYYAHGGYYAQPATVQPMQITVPSPGFARNQPMASLVPAHMRNRVGPVRCTYESCLFAGSQKEVEVHRMDRHLIFPLGWEENQGQKKRKRGKDLEDTGDDAYVDEEAQFRGNGSVAILGTDTKLDSPEAIAAWLEARKQRWPSAKRIADKVQARREALERGQIVTETQKPHRSDSNISNNRGTMQRGRGRDRGRGRGRDIGGIQRNPTPSTRPKEHSDYGRAGRLQGAGRDRERRRGGTSVTPSTPLASDSSNLGDKSLLGSLAASSSDLDSGLDSGSSSNTDSEGSSGSDMDPIEDAVSSKLAPNQNTNMGVELENAKAEEPTGTIEPTAISQQAKVQPFKKRPSQPPKAAYNPFNRRPNLLRNLLEPDIQATVSNLSQAIRFLVANDFLDNVELRPGDADNTLVQPLGTNSTEP